MKKHILLVLLSIVAISVQAQKSIYICQGNNYTPIALNSVGEMPFSHNGTVLTINGINYNVAEIDSITFALPSFATRVVVTYSENTAKVEIPTTITGVTYAISGADVILTSSNVTDDLEYILQGSSTNGSLTYNGNYKCKFILNGLTLTSTKQAAINVQCGKRIGVVLNEGTVNTLADASSGSHNAAFYFRGHPEFEGAGTLRVVGNNKHAISSKEYIQLKKSTGAIHITSAVSDGIHAGQYFQMNGGNVTISGVGGDGIQSEKTSDPTDELNGQMLIKGGTIHITLASQDMKALKSDSTITITGGAITLNVPGNGSKGISSDGSVIINEKDASTVINITASGGTYTDESGDINYCMGMNIKKDLTVTAGTITVTNTGESSRGIKVDGTYYANGGTVTANITAGNTVGVKAANLLVQEGAIFQINCAGADSKGIDISELATFEGGAITITATGEDTKGIRASQNLKINGGKYSFDVKGNSAKGIKAEKLEITNGELTFNTSGSPIVENYDPSYCTGIKTTTLLQQGGSIKMICTGQANKGISIDGEGVIEGGNIDITTSGAGGYYSLASGYDTYASTAITSDDNLTLNGGNITLKSTGSGGKGIKCDKKLTIGADSNKTATISVTTTGASYTYSSSVSAKAKAIKALGDIKIAGGSSTILTSQREAEGIESKSNIEITGGEVIVNAYDDAMNAAGTITFSGGKSYAYSSANDAIDSNYGRSGAVVINGGLLIACGATSPEQAIDCDNYAYIKLDGGTVFAMGGQQGNSSNTPSCGQGTINMRNISLTANQYLTLKNSSGNAVFTVQIPRTISQSYGFLSDAGVVNGTYTLATSSTAPTTYTSVWKGLYSTPSTSTGTSLGNGTVSSNYGTIGSASSGGGGPR